MSNPGGASISAEQLKARYVGTGTYSGITFVLLFRMDDEGVAVMTKRPLYFRSDPFPIRPLFC